MWDKMIRLSQALFDRLWINVETGRRPATSAHRLRVSERRTSDMTAENTSFITSEAPRQPAAKRSDTRQRVGWGGGGGTQRRRKTTGFCILAPPWQPAPTDQARAWRGGGDSSAGFGDSPWLWALTAPLSSPLPDVRGRSWPTRLWVPKRTRGCPFYTLLGGSSTASTRSAITQKQQSTWEQTSEGAFYQFLQQLWFLKRFI